MDGVKFASNVKLITLKAARQFVKDGVEWTAQLTWNTFSGFEAVKTTPPPTLRPPLL